MTGPEDDIQAAGDELRDMVETSLVIPECPHPWEPPKEDLA